MKQLTGIAYEKPELQKYSFSVADGAPDGGLSQGGDITNPCDGGFDDED